MKLCGVAVMGVVAWEAWAGQGGQGTELEQDALDFLQKLNYKALQKNRIISIEVMQMKKMKKISFFSVEKNLFWGLGMRI